MACKYDMDPLGSVRAPLVVAREGQRASRGAQLGHSLARLTAQHDRRMTAKRAAS
jgi:hypothetical protein